MADDTGVQNVMRAIGQAKAGAERRIEDMIDTCLTIVLNKADYYCPKETGAMAATGRKEVTGKGFATRCLVAYGGPTAPYTLFVHEDTDAFHNPPTCAQWLTRAVRESRGRMAQAARGRSIEAAPQKVIGGEVVR